MGDAGAKPHSPVRLVINAKPNSVMMKTLKPPLAMGADLPFGPTPYCPEQESMVASDFVGSVAKVEEQLTHLLGLTPEEAAKTQARAEGAKFAWRPALGRCDTSRARTTSVSRAWRKTAAWLADARRTKLELKKRAAWWKVVWYDHPPPEGSSCNQRAEGGHEGLWRLEESNIVWHVAARFGRSNVGRRCGETG